MSDEEQMSKWRRLPDEYRGGGGAGDLGFQPSDMAGSFITSTYERRYRVLVAALNTADNDYDAYVAPAGDRRAADYRAAYTEYERSTG